MEIAPEKVAELIDYMRMMDGKEGAGGYDGGQDGYEDGAIHVLETLANDGTKKAEAEFRRPVPLDGPKLWTLARTRAKTRPMSFL